MHKLIKIVFILSLTLSLLPLVYGQEKSGMTSKKDVLKEIIDEETGKTKTVATTSETPETGTEVAPTEEVKEISISDILSTKAGIKSLTGESRLFPYNPLKRERRDPLTIPWVKKDVDAQNLFNKGLDYKNKNQIKKAIATFNILINNFPDTSWASKAKDELTKLEKLVKSGQFAESDEAIAVVKLPDELRTQLSGIIWDEKEPMVILADRVLHEGDIIPELNATIVKINKSEVVYLYKKTFFRVPLIGR